MSNHRLRATAKGGQHVNIECGWDSKKQHHYLSIEDARFPPRTENGDYLDYREWPADLIMYIGAEGVSSPLSLPQVKAKFEELGITPPDALLVHLQLEQEQNLDKYNRLWTAGSATNYEANYRIELSREEVDPRLLGANAPQTITLDSTQMLASASVRQRLKELNITYGYDLEIEVTVTIGANVTLGDDVLFQRNGHLAAPAGSVRVGAGSHIESGVLINHGCVIGKGVRIGEGTEVVEDVHIDDNAQIGANCWIERQAYIGQGAKIGAKARINKGQRVPARVIVPAGGGWTDITK